VLWERKGENFASHSPYFCRIVFTAIEEVFHRAPLNFYQLLTVNI
jgi:hypothetical protein